jgi:hypothetical protein
MSISTPPRGESKLAKPEKSRQIFPSSHSHGWIILCCIQLLGRLFSMDKLTGYESPGGFLADASGVLLLHPGPFLAGKLRL